MTSTTAIAKTTANADDDTKDAFTQYVADLRDYLAKKPEATFKTVFERFLVHMFTEVRTVQSEQAGDIEDLYERFSPPELEMLADMEATLTAAGLFIDLLLQHTGLVKADDKKLPENFPLRQQYDELAGMMKDMHEQIVDARAQYDDDGDDDDPSGEGEPVDDDEDNKAA